MNIGMTMKRTVGGLIAAIALLAGPAQAQSVKVERIEVARPGTYEIEVGKPIPDAGVATGNRVEAKAYKSVKVGSRIRARVGPTTVDPSGADRQRPESGQQYPSVASDGRHNGTGAGATSMTGGGNGAEFEPAFWPGNPNMRMRIGFDGSLRS